MADMNKPLFDLDQPGMNAEVNSYIPGKGFVWATLFPLKFTPKFDIKGIEGEDGLPISADRIAFNARSKNKTRKTVGSWSGKLGKISISRSKDELEINEYNDLKVIANANTEDKASAKYLVDMIYDDVKFVNDGMDMRVEIDALRIGCSGKQAYNKAIDGNMITEDVINFNIPESNKGGVAFTWANAANADGIADIARMQSVIKGKKKPQYAILEVKAFEQLLAQERTIRRVASIMLNATNLASSDVLDITNVNSYMRKKGYPQFLVIDTWGNIENDNGEEETFKIWNENVVALSPVPQLGFTYYKPVPMVTDTAALQTQGKYYKTTRYSGVNPSIETTLAEAYVQPGLTNRKSLCLINITGSTWSDGASLNEANVAKQTLAPRGVVSPTNGGGAVSSAGGSEVADIQIYDRPFAKSVVITAMKGIGVNTPSNILDATLINKINELTDEQEVQLKIALGVE